MMGDKPVSDGFGAGGVAQARHTIAGAHMSRMSGTMVIHYGRTQAGPAGFCPADVVHVAIKGRSPSPGTPPLAGPG